MTKADIAEIISGRLELSRKESAELVDALLEVIKKGLEKDEKVKISAFGSFEVKKKGDRRGRNPQTGEDLTIKARRVLSFKPSPIFRNGINK